MNTKFIKKIFVSFLIFLLLSLLILSTVNAAEQTTPKITSPSALLMDLKTGKILYQKKIDKKMYPASLTKILTAIITLEKCDLDETATVSYDAVMTLSSGYVTANLQVGEELSVEQLLYVLMVGSSNDAAIVLAEHISGNVDDFSKLMNKKAKEIGCTSSNFVNPNGAHDPNHYSTARDLSLITKYAMKNDTFRTLVSTTSYQLPKTNKYNKDDRLFTTTNALLLLNNNSRSDNYYYKYATGVKTGFTTPAGNCLIASANKDNLELLTVILGAGQTEDGLSSRYIDTKKLFEFGYSNYLQKEIIKKDGIVQSINIKNATRNTKKLDALVSNNISALVNKENKDTIYTPEVKLNDNLKAPIKKGEIIGKVTYNIEDIEYTEDLIASHDVQKSNLFIKILLIIIAILLFRLYLKSIKIKNKRKKQKLKQRTYR